LITGRDKRLSSPKHQDRLWGCGALGLWGSGALGLWGCESLGTGRSFPKVTAAGRGS